MSNVVIAGTPPSGATALPAANSIDPVNDYLPIYTASATATQAINRNTLLNLTSQPVGISDTQTLTNKTITSPTISSPTFSGTTAGTFTLGGTITFPSSIVTLTGSQTLTNKTLTSPTINAPTITNATITADAIVGYTTSGSGTIYGLGIASGGFTGAISVAGLLTASNGFTLSGGTLTIPTNSVTAANLATNAITLGYTAITSTFNTSSGSVVQVTGLTTTVTIPSGSRKIKITVFAPTISVVTSGNPKVSIWDGTVGSGTQLSGMTYSTTANSGSVVIIAVVSPSAGSKTYNVGLYSTGSSSTTLFADSTDPAFILVEAI